MPELPTVDLVGVEILAVGGPVRGRGSAPGGDYVSRDDLRALAAADADLGAEVRPPARIGHEGGAPAVGWLENVRLNDDGTKLLADIKRVPRQFAELVNAGAYRTRSVELGPLTSQRTGRRFEKVVKGLAWLGGRLPACQTLDDVVALYEADAADDTVDVDAEVAQALREGRIGRHEEPELRRAFAIGPDFGRFYLDGRKPTVVGPGVEMSLPEQFEAQLAHSLGVTREDLI